MMSCTFFKSDTWTRIEMKILKSWWFCLVFFTVNISAEHSQSIFQLNTNSQYFSWTLTVNISVEHSQSIFQLNTHSQYFSWTLLMRTWESAYMRSSYSLVRIQRRPTARTSSVTSASSSPSLRYSKGLWWGTVARDPQWGTVARPARGPQWCMVARGPQWGTVARGPQCGTVARGP